MNPIILLQTDFGRNILWSTQIVLPEKSSCGARIIISRMIKVKKIEDYPDA